MILSLAPLTVLPASPLDQIDAAHATGFDAVGLRLQPVIPTDVDVMGNAALLRDIGRRLAPTGFIRGEGSLPLLELLDALPPGIPLSVEAPASHCAHLSTVQRAHAVARCTQKLIESRCSQALMSKQTPP